MARWQIYEAGMYNLLESPRGEVARFHRRTARRVRAEIQKRTPVRTGRLRRSWRTKFQLRGRAHLAWVYTRSRYAPYLIFGTGPIVPRRKKALRFRSRSGDWVIVARTRGVKPHDFVHAGLLAGTGQPWDVRFRHYEAV